MQSEIPTWRGRQPDAIKFTFSGSVDIENDEPDKMMLAGIRIGEEVDLNCAAVVAGHAFSTNDDDELLLTVKLKALDCAADLSGLPEDDG